MEEQDRIFLQVNPPDKFGRVYGIGSLGTTLSESFSVSQQPQGSRADYFTNTEVEEIVSERLTQAVTPLQHEIERMKAEQDRTNAQVQELLSLWRGGAGPSS